jgi:hypothetical protein
MGAATAGVALTICGASMKESTTYAPVIGARVPPEDALQFALDNRVIRT